MKTIASIATLMLMTALAHAQGADQPQIKVTGEATVLVAPDLALIQTGVRTDAKTARDAAEANNAVMGKVLLAIKSAGIDEKDIQTQRLSLWPIYGQTTGDGVEIIRSYRASNNVVIKMRELSRVAAIIDASVAAGANQIGGISFIVAQPSKLLDDARLEAVVDARRKAEIYAKAAGVQLGAPLNVSEQGASPVYRRPMEVRRANTATPIEQGEEELRVTVSVTWAIKAAKTEQ